MSKDLSTGKILINTQENEFRKEKIEHISHEPLLVLLPGYLLYCAFQFLLLPYLLVNFARRLLIDPKGKYRAGFFTKLTGSTPPRRANWLLLVATDMGEARTAVMAGKVLHQHGRKDIAIWVKFGKICEKPIIKNAGVTTGIAPYNNPISALIALWRWRPQIILFIENPDNVHLAFWARALGVRTLVANASLSETRLKRYSRRPLSRWRVGVGGPLAAQGESARKRFIQLGIHPHQVAVFPPILPDPVPEEVRLRRANYWHQELHIPNGKMFILVAGNTHPEEEPVVIQAFRELQRAIPEALLILAPRHPIRPGGPDSVLRSEGVRYVRRSELRAGTEQRNIAPIVLLDTEGELADIYSIAEVAFIGGSLIPHYGGHSPIEALAWGVPITMGPYFGHQEALVTQCRAERLLTICTNTEDLTAAWLKWAQDEEARKEVRERAMSLLASRHDIFLAWETLARNQASWAPRRVRASAVHDKGKYPL
ncbi:MAG: glycosyltransferase N-terminal domain-containing protein [Candidatus Caldarchaeum sp.]